MGNDSGTVNVTPEEAIAVPNSIASQFQLQPATVSSSVTVVTLTEAVSSTDQAQDVKDAPFGKHLREAREVIVDWWQNH